MPLENVNRRNAIRIWVTGKKVESRSEHLVLATTGEGIWRTEGETIEPLGLPNETVELEHLIYPTLRNHGIDLMAEGFDIL
jgi:hypothetical protein